MNHESFQVMQVTSSEKCHFVIDMEIDEVEMSLLKFILFVSFSTVLLLLLAIVIIFFSDKLSSSSKHNFLACSIYCYTIRLNAYIHCCSVNFYCIHKWYPDVFHPFVSVNFFFSIMQYAQAHCKLVTHWILLDVISRNSEKLFSQNFPLQSIFLFLLFRLCLLLSI